MGVQRDWQHVCEMATGVKRGDCDSRFTSFGWGVAVRFIWVRESSSSRREIGEHLGPRLAIHWWKRANALHEDITQVFVSITKQTVVYPLWFSEGKTQLMLKPGSFSSENQRPITCLNWTRQKANFIGCFCLLYCMKTRSLLRQTPNCPLIPIHGPHWYYTETILICGLQSTWTPFSCWTHYFFHKINDIQY